VSPPEDAEVVVRPATSADLPALDRLQGLSTSTRRGLARELARAEAEPRGDVVVLVAVRCGESVGAAFGRLQVDDGHVIDLAVAPAARRSGLGRALLRRLAAELRTRGARAITLEVRAGNLPALALYRGEGYVVEGRRPGYYPDGEDALLLWQHEPGVDGDGPAGGVAVDRPAPPPRGRSAPARPAERDHPRHTAWDIVPRGG
jgi:[ribosomal protein S18]-alanine N-acetyltransferase